MAAHSSILAWRSPWAEDPGGLQTRGLQGVRHARSNSMHTAQVNLLCSGKRALESKGETRPLQWFSEILAVSLLSGQEFSLYESQTGLE